MALHVTEIFGYSEGLKEAITTEATRAVESNRRFMRPAVNVVIVAVDSVEINGLPIRVF